MFIIDEIYRDDGAQLGKDLPGGGGKTSRHILSHLAAEKKKLKIYTLKAYTRLWALAFSIPLRNPSGYP